MRQLVATGGRTSLYEVARRYLTVHSVGAAVNFADGNLRL